MPIRVRFAPSPTGYLHVGGARTALFNWLFARREGGAFLLRIEDTDRDRSSPEMVRAILDGMRFLGLDWDEGLVFQSEGVERHRADALRLLAEGRAFRDFTAPADLARLREEDPSRVVRYPREIADAMTQEEAEARAEAGEPHAIRFRVPDGATGWEDRVHGPTRFQNADIEDLVILRSDGTPTYNLAVASDDRGMRITHVIRGDDHISNTPKQILIHEALGSPVPIFAHLPMILGPDGKRLSKRHGATAVGDYAAQGILPETLVNFLALLGWSPGTDEEILDRTALIERFSLDRVLKKSAVFDPAKLEWMNGRHLSLRSTEDLLAPVLEALGPDRGEAEDWLAGDRLRLTRLIDLLKPRSRTIREMAEQARPYVLERIDRDPDAVRKHWEKDPEAVRGHLSALTERFAVAEWEEAELEAELRALADARGVGAGKLIHPLRVAVTGRSVSPGIFEVLVLLGRERSLARLQQAQEWLSGPPSENS
jgi:glutamyl-tRNA synthetase